MRDHTNQVVAAVSIAGPVFRVSRQRLPELSKLVKRTAADLSRALGYSVS
ncbi:MAG: IclR family transcriptional regulator domain-containing protein [Bryobacteraceae bacterium]